MEHEKMTSIGAGIDGSQPWRRTYSGHNITCTDWQKDYWFHAVRKVIPRVRRFGIEFDHISLDTMALLRHEFPLIEFVDITVIAMR